MVASGDAVIAVGGEWGTLSEIALARRLGHPVVALRSWTLENAAVDDLGITESSDAAEAVAFALGAARAAPSGIADGRDPVDERP